ncbi:MAG: glucose/arabinose dehydrogenase [Planctomycetota bacterium]
MITATLTLALALSAQTAATPDLRAESQYYSVDYLTPPEGAVLEVGGMAWMPDGRLAVSTRRGQVWLVENALAEDPSDARFHLYAEGLREGLGMAVVEGELFVLQRGELSRLRDVDGDDRIDHIDTIANGWGLSGNYHEFAFGLPVTPEGDFIISLNVSFFSPKWWHGKSPQPWRGWMMRIGMDGSMEPVALGLRSPAGMGYDAQGRLFVTDNQGDWMASSPIFHIKEGAFYGHPASLKWTDEYRTSQSEPSDTIPPARANHREDASVWIPYEWSRSTGALMADASRGKFGPFTDQLLVAELTNGMLLRAQMETVRGQLQGAVWPMRRKVGSLSRLLQAPDGTVIGGMTNRGWGGLSPADGLARIRWTGVAPMEMKSVRLLQRGFEVEFTRPVAAELNLAPSNVQLTHFDYDYWWEYGSPERDTRVIDVRSLHLSRDRTRLTILTGELEPARVARLRFQGVVAEGGFPLLHDTCAYTIRQLPEGPLTELSVAKIVPPPPARGSGEDGWLRLTWGDALDAFDSSGWELCSAEVAESDPTRFVIKEGNGALVNTAPDASEFVSKSDFRDYDLTFDFKLPEGASAGVLLNGSYEFLLSDADQLETSTKSLGTLVAGLVEGGAGVAPARNAYRGTDMWHAVEVNFRAPRFDATGNKIKNAVLQRLKVDDILLHERVELTGPSQGATRTDESAMGPVIFRSHNGSLALGDIRIRPTRVEGEILAGKPKGDGWQAFFGESGIDDWTAEGEAIWELEDGVLVGEGPQGHLFSPRSDYKDHELRMWAKISDGGNSGIYMRATPTGDWPTGYQAEINASFPDAQKSGSVYDVFPLLTHLVGPDNWFEYGLRCEEVAGGTRIRVWMNGILVSDNIDASSRHKAGHIAIQQHHESSVVEIRDAWVRDF